MSFAPKGQDSPLTVFRNGHVFTADAARTWARAVAVEAGMIVAVGGDDAVAPYLSRADEVVDLDGRLLLPGFVDAHAHPVNGGLERARKLEMERLTEERRALRRAAADAARHGKSVSVSVSWDVSDGASNDSLLSDALYSLFS